MEYHKLVSVTGLSGLFELLSSKSDGAVVRSLEDKSTKFVSSRKHNFSHLESIEVYTTKDNTNLADVFLAMKASTEKVPESGSDTKSLKAYFDKIYPDLDHEKVYASDMKKMVKWYHILQENDVEVKMRSEEERKEEDDVAALSKPATEQARSEKMKPQQAKPRKIESRGVK